MTPEAGTLIQWFRYIQTSQRNDQTDRKTEETTETRTGAGTSGIETRERNRDYQCSRDIEIETGNVTLFQHMLLSLEPALPTPEESVLQT